MVQRYSAAERDFRAADLTRANLFEATLGGAALNEANLGWAQVNTCLVVAYLVDADLEDSNLRGARAISGERFSSPPTLRKLTWRGLACEAPILRELTGADLSWSNLNRANLEGALVDGIDFSAAQYDKDTVWPDGFNLPDTATLVSAGKPPKGKKPAAPPLTPPESVPTKPE